MLGLAGVADELEEAELDDDGVEPDEDRDDPALVFLDVDVTPEVLVLGVLLAVPVTLEAELDGGAFRPIAATIASVAATLVTATARRARSAG